MLIELHAINMELYQNWTLLQRPQEILIIAVINNEITKTKIGSETPLNGNSHHIEASQLIRKANHLTDFHTMQLPTKKYFQTDLSNRVQIASL